MKSNILTELTTKVINNGAISYDEAMTLTFQDTHGLSTAANHIRKHFCSDSFSLCTIVSGKTGNCSEDCKFCAQSTFSMNYDRGNSSKDSSVFQMLSSEQIINAAISSETQGSQRFSVVTSGRRLEKSELERLCHDYKKINSLSPIKLCASHGLLDYDDFIMLKISGVTRYHNNLETSRRYFSRVCTSHSFDDKLQTLKAAKKAGLSLCSGGIIGMGETMEDRISMAMDLREIEVDSIPINVLNPIPGTAFESLPPIPFEEVIKTIAIFRFILPDKFIRLAGGRTLLPQGGKECLLSGANALISGDMLTTGGLTLSHDIKMAKDLGFTIGSE